MECFLLSHCYPSVPPPRAESRMCFSIEPFQPMMMSFTWSQTLGNPIASPCIEGKGWMDGWLLWTQSMHSLSVTLTDVCVHLCVHVSLCVCACVCVCVSLCVWGVSAWGLVSINRRDRCTLSPNFHITCGYLGDALMRSPYSEIMLRFTPIVHWMSYF